jgi:hypothetical protein
MADFFANEKKFECQRLFFRGFEHTSRFSRRKTSFGAKFTRRRSPTHFGPKKPSIFRRQDNLSKDLLLNDNSSNDIPLNDIPLHDIPLNDILSNDIPSNDE